MKLLNDILKQIVSIGQQLDSAFVELDKKEQILKKQKRYASAKDVLTKMEQIESYKQAINDLIKLIKTDKDFPEELELVEEKEPEKLFHNKTIRKDLGKIKHHKRTPEEAYYIPILQALQEMGGSARMSDVIDRVGQIMKTILVDIDYQSVNSDSDEIRWINTARWARNTMVQELGYLKKDSTHGIWEISQKGIEYLKDNTGK